MDGNANHQKLDQNFPQNYMRKNEDLHIHTSKYLVNYIYLIKYKISKGLM